MKNPLNKIKRINLRKQSINLLPVIPRHDDIFLVSFPKSGNTWLTFLIANVILRYLNIKQEVNFFNLHTIIPDIHQHKNISPILNYSPFKRIIKSHSSFNPYYNFIFLLIRDPRDVMVSFYYFKKKLNQFEGDLSSFIRDKKFGIQSWINHTKSWLIKTESSKSLRLIFYEDLKRDTGKELNKIFSLMGFTIDNDTIDTAVKSSSFEEMKKLELQTRSYTEEKFKNFTFMRKGIIGSGKEELSKNDLDYINEIAREMMKKLRYHS